MNDTEFQTFCYDEYKRSLDSREDTYRRYPFAVTAIVVLATATISLGSNKYLPHCFARVDVTLYYAGIALSLFGIARSTTLLIKSILPKNYDHVDSPLKFHEWRESYRNDLLARGYSSDVVGQQVATETKAALTLRLAQATAKNIETNRAGMRPYNRAMYAIALSVVSLGVAAVFSWIINYRGLS